MRTLLPAGWPRPKGYANGVEAEGRLVFVAGQIGWDARGVFPEGFAAQFRRTLENTLAVLAEAGAAPAELAADRTAAEREMLAAFLAARAAPFPDPSEAFTDVQDAGPPSLEHV